MHPQRILYRPNANAMYTRSPKPRRPNEPSHRRGGEPYHTTRPHPPYSRNYRQQTSKSRCQQLQPSLHNPKRSPRTRGLTTRRHYNGTIYPNQSTKWNRTPKHGTTHRHTPYPRAGTKTPHIGQLRVLYHETLYIPVHVCRCALDP